MTLHRTHYNDHRGAGHVHRHRVDDKPNLYRQAPTGATAGDLLDAQWRGSLKKNFRENHEQEVGVRFDVEQFRP